jgi:hypothetical protein
MVFRKPIAMSQFHARGWGHSPLETFVKDLDLRAWRRFCDSENRRAHPLVIMPTGKGRLEDFNRRHAAQNPGAM